MLFDFLAPEEALLAGLADFTAPPVEPDVSVILDKYVAASVLQKALRRKQFDRALWAARQIMAVDVQYLFRRLKCCALEDVGVSGLQEAAQVLWVSGKQQWMSGHGGADFIAAYLISILCHTNAYRACDDFLYIASQHPHYQEQRVQYSGMTEDELFDLFLNHDLDPVEQTLACWFLCGTRYKWEGLELKKARPAAVIDLATHIGVPPFVSDLMALSRSQEFYVTLLPSWLACAGSSNHGTINDAPYPSVMHGPIPSEALDMHTRPGKHAFRLFLKQCPEVKTFLHRHCAGHDLVNIIGQSVFSIEGELLNNRITFDGSEDIRRQAKEAWLSDVGLAGDKQTELLTLIRENMPRLYDARDNAVKRYLT